MFYRNKKHCLGYAKTVVVKSYISMQHKNRVPDLSGNGAPVVHVHFPAGGGDLRKPHAPRAAAKRPKCRSTTKPHCSGGPVSRAPQGARDTPQKIHKSIPVQPHC